MQITDEMYKAFRRESESNKWDILSEEGTQLGFRREEATKAGIEAALAVADADAPDGDAFEEALEDFAREQAQLWGGSGNGRKLEAARARVIALHRSAEQKAKAEVLGELREIVAFIDDHADASDPGSWGLAGDAISFVESKIDAMLKEGTNG